MSITVRDATKHDYGYVMGAFGRAHGEILVASPELHRTDYPQTPRWKYNASLILRDVFKDQSRCLRIGELDHRPVGVVYAERISRNSWSAYQNHVRLDNVYVDEEYRRQGVATALITSAQEWAQAAGYDYMDAKILLGNEASRALCAKAGFHEQHVLVGMGLNKDV